MSTGVPALDRHICYESIYNDCGLNGQIDLRLDDRLNTDISDTEYVLTQERVEETGEFELSLQVITNGQTIITGKKREKSFLGLPDDEIQEMIGRVRSRSPTLTVDKINQWNQKLDFSIYRDRLKVTDELGSFYLKYGMFDINILHLTKEPNLLHSVFWSSKKELTALEGNLHLDEKASNTILTQFMAECMGFLHSLKASAQLDDCSKDHNPSLDVPFILRDIDDLYKCSQIITPNLHLMETLSTQCTEEYKDSLLRYNQVFEYLSDMSKALQKGDKYLFIDMIRKMPDNYYSVFDTLNDNTMGDINLFLSIDSQKLMEFCTVTHTIADLREFISESARIKSLPQDRQYPSFLRYLSCHLLYPNIVNLIISILENNPMINLHRKMRIYPLLNGKHIEKRDDDKDADDMIKEVWLDEGLIIDAKIENKQVWIRESSKEDKVGKWRLPASENIELKRHNRNLFAMNKGLGIFDSAANDSFSKMYILIPNPDKSTQVDTPVGIWYQLESEHTPLKYIGNLDNDTIVVTTKDDDNNLYLTFARINHTNHNFEVIFEVATEYLLPSRSRQDTEDANIQFEYEYAVIKINPLFFLKGNILFAIHQGEKEEIASLADKDFTVWRLKQSNIKTSTEKKDMDSSYSVEFDKLAEYTQTFTFDTKRSKSYLEDIHSYCTFFKFNTRLYLFVYYSMITYRVNVLSVNTGNNPSITPLHKISADINDRLCMEEKMQMVILPYWNAERRLLSFSTASALACIHCRLYFFKLE